MSHKITEPYAQIPTLDVKKVWIENAGNWIESQNNRALRSNPNFFKEEI